MLNSHYLLYHNHNHNHFFPNSIESHYYYYYLYYHDFGHLANADIHHYDQRHTYHLSSYAPIISTCTRNWIYLPSADSNRAYNV